MYSHLFSPLKVDGLSLKNRIVMAPLYLGYAGEGGTVTELLIEHYRVMARSGVALVVVENASIDYPTGSGSNRTLRADTGDNMKGLAKLAMTIKQEGALACLQLNHAGRFAGIAPDPVAPSAVEVFGRTPRPLTMKEMGEIREKFVAAALRVKQAGFDMVELHGGTGYLLAQFLSPRTNRRTDKYGGSLENRQRFPLEVVKAVKASLGDFPIGYRFLADEWLPDGLKLEESRKFARALEATGISYISVMGGTYESFFLPEVVEKSKRDGYMVDLAAAIKKEVSVPVITAGRIATGALAERVIAEGKADLVGLARVLWTDPEWPHKVETGRENEIVHCDSCDACLQMVMQGEFTYCVQWPTETQQAWQAKFK
ncbi:MAG: NADH:flavin oxidoreductase [Candidatus Abyssobacteria bacterium SURF_17]|uniref:NADH:flavin oxidoreductase n=1 Tax=Candidatus Abyssobacteria bacterium SURF_17 TaxID=2093361 RepID=A0A419EV06_9BACT|nr:MAG: NADH:flavin oxidoreductase [Candidatus Abyssubacteria bacterium SURF_17]